jgi:hypothetical protein
MSTASENVGPLGTERRVLPRYHLLKRVDIVVADGDVTYWGRMKNLSRTGVAVAIRQDLKRNQKVTVRFRMESDDERVVIEDLTATVIWKDSEHAGLEFTKPLIEGSSALKKAPYLATHLDKKKSER